MLFNKIFGAVLAVALAIMALSTITAMLFGKGPVHGGHHGDEEHSINEQLAANFAYYTEIADEGGEAKEEVVFDLGALLAMADPSKGEKSFKAKCSSCHTIEDGGANGTGPNLHDVVGRPIASHAGFSYSSAMQQHGVEDGDWSYIHLNDFIENPKGAVAGTAMAFAGLRKEPERMDVIAYLASVNAAAPAFPDPLPAAAPEGDETTAEGEAVDGEATPAEGMAEGADAVVEGAQDAVDGATEAVTEAAETATEAVKDAADKAADKVNGPHGAGNH